MSAADGTRASEPLYAWWLGVIPSLLGSLMPKAGFSAPGSPVGDAAGAAPFPAGEISRALALSRDLLEPLFQGYLKALTLNPQPDQAFGHFQGTVQSQLQKLADGLNGVAQTLSAAMPFDASADAWKLLGEPAAMFGQALKPLSTNLERTYGGLVDAFGLAPSRELLGALRDAAATTVAKQQAQAEYLGLIAGALAKGSEALVARLQAMGERGESVDSLLGLVRLWARSAEETMHAAMQSPKALDASAKLVRAGMRSRQQQQRIVALTSEALNVPTREEVDAAYREIQELKRELRRLRKAIGVPVALTTTRAASAVEAPVSPAAKGNGAAATATESPAPAAAASADAPARPRKRSPAAKRGKTTPKAPSA